MLMHTNFDASTKLVIDIIMMTTIIFLMDKTLIKRDFVVRILVKGGSFVSISMIDASKKGVTMMGASEKSTSLKRTSTKSN